MVKVTVIAGLPGSGKTTLLRRDYSDVPRKRIFDNYMKDSGAPTNSPHLAKMEKRDALLWYLKAGDDCIVTDIQFIGRTFHERFVSDIQKEVSGIEVERIAFKKQPERNLKNIVRRAEKELMKGVLEAFAHSAGDAARRAVREFSSKVERQVLDVFDRSPGYKEFGDRLEDVHDPDA